MKKESSIQITGYRGKQPVPSSYTGPETLLQNLPGYTFSLPTRFGRISLQARLPYRIKLISQ
jgi:hypothetical protein